MKLLLIAASLLSIGARADLTSIVANELGKQFPGSRIELTDQVQWTRGTPVDEVRGASILATDGRGGAQFVARGKFGEVAEGRVSFAAWSPARVATRRILPGQRLEAESFSMQDVNVATGQAYEYRGTILQRDADLSKLEARQTVIEGQYLTTPAVQRVPDVRRGDQVRIHVISGELTLSTAGVAEEPGYINGPMRVISGKSKRELVGKLQAGAVVEVRL